MGFKTKSAANSVPILRGWQLTAVIPCEFCELILAHFVLKLRSHDQLNTVLFWINLLSESL